MTYLTVKEASRKLSVCDRTVRLMIKNRRLVAMWTGKGWQIEPHSVATLVSARKAKRNALK